MHTHQSLWKGGKNLFYQKGGYADISEMCKHYIGGHPEARAGAVRAHRALHQLVPPAGARLRGADQPRLQRAQPLGGRAHPDVLERGEGEAPRVPHARPDLQPVPVVRGLRDGRARRGRRTRSTPASRSTRTSTSCPRRKRRRSSSCRARSTSCSTTSRRTTSSCSRATCSRKRLHRDLDRVQAQERGRRDPAAPAPVGVRAVLRHLKQGVRLSRGRAALRAPQSPAPSSSGEFLLYSLPPPSSSLSSPTSPTRRARGSRSSGSCRRASDPSGTVARLERRGPEAVGLLAWALGGSPFVAEQLIRHADWVDLLTDRRALARARGRRDVEGEIRAALERADPEGAARRAAPRPAPGGGTARAARPAPPRARRRDAAETLRARRRARGVRARGGLARAARRGRAARTAAPVPRDGLRRAGLREARRLRAQLQLGRRSRLPARHRPRCGLEASGRAAPPRVRGSARAAAHRRARRREPRRARLPRRPAAAARGRRGNDQPLARHGRRVLRDARRDLGAARADQGATGGRRLRARQGAACAACGPSSGAGPSATRSCGRCSR